MPISCAEMKIEVGLRRLLGPMAGRRAFIENELTFLGRTCARLEYSSALGAGVNYFSPPLPHLEAADCLLVAHYDGETAHDNAGGVLAVLDILRRSDESRSASVAALFSDMEETFQQGAATFVANQRQREQGRIVDDCMVLCVDGFGGGKSLLVRPHDRPLSVDGVYFRMDADVFREAGYPTYTASTGFDCLCREHGALADQAAAITASPADILSWLETAGEFLESLLGDLGSVTESWRMLR